MTARISRRQFLRIAPLSVAGMAFLAACGGATSTPTTAPAATTSSTASTTSASTSVATSTTTAASTAAGAASSAATSARTTGGSSSAPAVITSTSASSSAAGGAPVNGGTFTYGNSKPSKNIINPLNTVGTGQNVLIEALFLRLVYGREWGTGLNPQASGPIDLGIAQKMTEVTKDQAWEFELRQNVKWHDGQPVTADDVIFGIWLALNKDAKTTNETPVGPIKGADKLKTQGGGSDTPPYNVVVDGATKLGDNAVRIELDQPIANFWVNWGVGYWPMPTHIFGKMPLDKLFDEPYATMPVGNGPFKASKFVDGQYMEMVANDDFFLGRPHVDKYIVRFGDADTLSAAMEAQEIDGTSVAPGPVYERLVGLPFIAGNPVPRDHPDGFVVNYGNFPKEAPTLTKAMMYAIDIPTLNKQLYSNTLRPSNYLFEHVVGLEQPPAGFPKYSYDPEKAKALLKQINWDPNKELSWLQYSKPTAVQDAMQAMLAAVGIKATYKIIDAATVIDELYHKYDYDLVYANFGPDQNMEANWKYIKCGWDYDTGGFNYAQYCNKDVDDIWAPALKETDAAKRKSMYDQISLKLGDAPPQATLARQSSAYVWNKRVQGAYPYQYRLPVRPALDRVWIKK
jgi:peptide/nickel transport system substrate-binding protein